MLQNLVVVLQELALVLQEPAVVLQEPAVVSLVVQLQALRVCRPRLCLPHQRMTSWRL